jgi:hypothetical protein
MDSSPQRHQRARTARPEGQIRREESSCTLHMGIDIRKAVFEVALSDAPGTVGERRRLSGAWLRRFFAGRETTTVLMEACGSAHYWGRDRARRLRG